MGEQFENYDLAAILKGKTVKEGVVDLNLLYKQSNNELALQQSKRDQTISLYLAICTFFIPLVFSFDLSWRYKGIMFVALGIIGAMFALVIIRYRIYKEAYWLCSRTISQLMKYQSSDLKKDLIQATFYSSIEKRGSTYVGDNNGKKYFKSWLYFKKNIFSAETLLYLILVFIVSLISGLGVGLVVSSFWLIIGIAVGISVGIITFIFLLFKFFRQSEKVYSVLVDNKNSSFNSVFSKAWFLHFYNEEGENIKKNAQASAQENNPATEGAKDAVEVVAEGNSDLAQTTKKDDDD